jgi:CheY-like chemotaxis protein
MEIPKYRILVVEDDELTKNVIVRYLSKIGHLCTSAMDGVEALDKIKESKFDAVVTDIRMPNMDGIALTKEILKKYPELPVMVMTGFDEEYEAGRAMAGGAREFIIKPFSLSEFAIRLHKMIDTSVSPPERRNEKDQDKNIHDLMNELGEMLKKE